MAIRTGYKHGPLSWVDLAARDMANAREFYKKLFGWDSVDVDTRGGPPYAHFTLRGHVVAGLRQLDAEPCDRNAPAIWNSYINVDDIEAVCANVAASGGRVAVPVTKLQDAGWFAFVQDPSGAEVGLWQKDQHIGAALAQDYNCFCWNELCTRDIDAAQAFFRQLFQWEFSEFQGGTSKSWVINNHGDETSGLMKIDEGWGDLTARWFVYFAVECVDITVDFVRQIGGYVLLRPVDIAEGRLAIVADSQGAMFQLVEASPPPAEKTDDE